MFRAVQLYDQYLIGREEGYKIGFEKGYKIGLEKSKKKPQYRIAQKLARDNFPDSQIATILRMTESDLADLRANPPEQEEESDV